MYCRHILPRLVFTASADADMARVDQAQRLIIEAMEAEPERPNLIEAVMALSGLLIAMIDRAQPDNDERRRLGGALCARRLPCRHACRGGAR